MNAPKLYWASVASLLVMAPWTLANDSNSSTPQRATALESGLRRLDRGGRQMTTYVRGGSNEARADAPEAAQPAPASASGGKSLAAGVDCVAPNRRNPGSLLLFPEYDNRSGAATVYTITNTDPYEDVYVEFVYLARYGPMLVSGVDNGDFSGGGVGWTTSVSPAQGGPAGSVTFQNGRACLLEGSSLLTSLSQDFVMPPGAQTLEFDLYLDPGFDLTANFIPDAFEAQLLDGALNSVVPSWTIGATSFFNLQEDLTENLGSGVTYQGGHVSLDVSMVPAGTNVTLYFDFVGADDDWDGGVKIDNVALSSGLPTDLGCTEFNRVEWLTPNDTLSFLTTSHNPDSYQGYAYAFARNSAGQAISFNRLAGQVMATNALQSTDYSFNAVAFASPAAMGATTDMDSDGIRDLNGAEYDRAPGELLIPRFYGQSPGYQSYLILIGLSGGTAFETTVDFLAYNDNEEVFSTQYRFSCWDRVPLLAISGVFGQSFLANNTNDDPTESLAGIETGWVRIFGHSASSTAYSIEDPAVYAVQIETLIGTSGADLPFEHCVRDGHLLPRSLFGDNEE